MSETMERFRESGPGGCANCRRFHEARDGPRESYGASGTPMFFINGRLVSGAQPFAVFARIVEEELAGKAGGGDGSRP